MVAVIGLSGLAAALLLTVNWSRKAEVHQPVLSQEERVDDTVAVLLQAAGAEWEKTDLPARVGTPLRPGVLRLRAGCAQLEFYCGATVVLEGPAEIQLISRSQAYCAGGKLRVTVPPQAQGFTIGSPRLDVVDRGTEFGLQVGAAGKTEVHVMQGKVELYDPGASPKNAAHKALTTGQAVRAEVAGALHPIALNAASFLTAKELAVRSQADAQRRQAKWQESNDRVRKDSSLLVYFVFEGKQPWDRELPDLSPAAHAGAIVGCSWVNGRLAWQASTGIQAGERPRPLSCAGRH